MYTGSPKILSLPDSLPQLSGVLDSQAYPCGIQGALESGFAASTFDGFFSRFGAFFSFISGSMPLPTR
jgi:hypothetical protein